MEEEEVVEVVVVVDAAASALPSPLLLVRRSRQIAPEIALGGKGEHSSASARSIARPAMRRRTCGESSVKPATLRRTGQQERRHRKSRQGEAATRRSRGIEWYNADAR